MSKGALSLWGLFYGLLLFKNKFEKKKLKYYLKKSWLKIE